MNVKINRESYNPKRYGSPWGAVVTVDNSNKLRYDFNAGSWIGDASEGGYIILTAKPGDVVGWGQKDNRGNGTDSSLAIVNENGELSLDEDGDIVTCTKLQAFEHIVERKNTPKMEVDAYKTLAAKLGITDDAVIADMRRKFKITARI
jgi:hypothetical protein